MGDQGEDAEGDHDVEPLGYEPNVAKGVEKVGPKAFKVPKAMTRAEKEVDDGTHTPFHPGCKYCVRNRARNLAHKTTKTKHGGARLVPKVSLDYFFMSEADRHAGSNPILVAVDEDTGDKHARAVGQKGLGDTVIGEMD